MSLDYLAYAASNNPFFLAVPISFVIFIAIVATQFIRGLREGSLFPAALICSLASLFASIACANQRIVYILDSIANIPPQIFRARWVSSCATTVLLGLQIGLGVLAVEGVLLYVLWTVRVDVGRTRKLTT